MSNVHVLACCTPVYKDHPSRVRKYHSMRCRISPGAEIVSTVVRRAEVASHAESNADDLDDSYMDYWADRAYEMEEGK